MSNQAVNASRSTIGFAGACAACCALLVVTVAPPALAVTLTNRDAKPYAIEVRVKSANQKHDLAPGKSLTGICKDGCIIRLNGSGDADYALEGTERVSIEGGLVYYDGEEIKPKDAKLQ